MPWATASAAQAPSVTGINLRRLGGLRIMHSLLPFTFMWLLFQTHFTSASSHLPR